jgi:hypothetical protein
MGNKDWLGPLEIGAVEVKNGSTSGENILAGLTKLSIELLCDPQYDSSPCVRETWTHISTQELVHKMFIVHSS